MERRRDGQVDLSEAPCGSAEYLSILGCLPRVLGGASARIWHREKNEKKSTHKTFEKTWRRVDTRGKQTHHISEG